jgi:peptidoglycan/LPS O-acetylase OafA/YrhL
MRKTFRSRLGPSYPRNHRNLSETTPAAGRYLPALDGWRAIAILAVVVHHDALRSMGPLSTQWLYQFGYVGVDLFFAVSGLLICSRLLHEESDERHIQIGAFYLRRAFRILPAALVYLCVLALLSAWFPLGVTFRELLESLLFVRNYPRLGGLSAGAASWYTSHFWSLAIEEQFYLFLPVFLFLAPKRSRIPVLALLAALVAAHRVSELHHRPWTLIAVHTDVRIDSLLAPALLAVLAAQPYFRELFKRLSRWWPALALVVLYLVAGHGFTAWKQTMIVWLTPCLVLASVLNPRGVLSTILEWTPLRWLGRISYSLYLWQQLFFNQHFNHGVYALGPGQSSLWRWPLLFACSIASYILVERPMIALGQTIHARRKSKLASTTPHRDGQHPRLLTHAR